MIGALMMTVIKTAALGGALVVNVVRWEPLKVGMCMDGELTEIPLGLALSPQRNPRKTCAILGPRSQPKRYLWVGEIRMATRSVELTDDPGWGERESENLQTLAVIATRREYSCQTRFPILPNVEIRYGKVAVKCGRSERWRALLKRMGAPTACAKKRRD